MKRIIIFTIFLFLGCSAISNAAEKNSTYIYPPWKHTWGVVRATPFKLRLFVGGKTHFNNPQGLAAVRLEAWEDTTRTGDDDEITAYGVNSGDNCIIYNRSMLSLGIYGLKKDHEKLNQPWGIAADAKGRVYVADRGNSRVVRLYNQGKELQFESVLGGPGDERGRFIDPRGVALDPQGFVYVTDAALGRVTVFDDDGNVSGVWEDFDGPDGIAVVGSGEKWNFRPQQSFAVVIDSLHRRIRKLSLSGELIAETTTSDWGVEDAFLAYVVIDYHNQILVTDKKNGCLHKLDADLNYITRFGESGSGDYQFDEPRGIAIYRRFGQLIVAERQGAQYLWVAVDVPSFSADIVLNSMWSDLKVAFELTEPAFCEMDILDSFGRFITRISTRRYFPAGSSSISWNMRVPKRQSDKSLYTELPPEYKPGQILPDGSYTVKARFRATYSSRKFYSREVEARFRLGE
ncbi:hypothetical protein HQ587_09440 [bacterium]|nr:hypothetical protein [bacterium]